MLLLFGCLDNVDCCFLNQRNNVLYCINDVLVCSIRHHDNTSEAWRQKQQERNKTLSWILPNIWLLPSYFSFKKCHLCHSRQAGIDRVHLKTRCLISVFPLHSFRTTRRDSPQLTSTRLHSVSVIFHNDWVPPGCRGWIHHSKLALKSLMAHVTVPYSSLFLFFQLLLYLLIEPPALLHWGQTWRVAVSRFLEF